MPQRSRKSAAVARTLAFGICLGIAMTQSFYLLSETDMVLRYEAARDKLGLLYTAPEEMLVKECDKEATEMERISEPTSIPPVSLRPEVREFAHQPGGVIAMKIHGTNHVPALKQSLCLLNQAYNKRVLYDILIFSSTHIPSEDLDAARAIVAPANLTIVVDNPGLHEQVNELSPERRTALLKRCNASKVEDLEWYTKCEDGNTNEKIAYTWQAEFRALHLWSNPALAPYKFMLWIDSDAFCTKPWPRDPIAVAMKNDLAILFAHFPQGRSQDPRFHDRFRTAFGRKICGVEMVDGHLAVAGGESCRNVKIPQVHGFLHVTNLEFYRSDPVMHWARTLIGDVKFSRTFDDQIGVTMPAAVYAPERSWEMGYHNITLDVYHNALLDGKTHSGSGGFLKWWRKNGAKQFPDADNGVCTLTDNN